MNTIQWPQHVSLVTPGEIAVPPTFWDAWKQLMQTACHGHSVWASPFVQALRTGEPEQAFQTATVWATNMVVGSYCFPRYVAALAARAEVDAVRYCLLENAWDEAGSYGHTSRSHFWLAVKLARLLGLSDSEISAIRPLLESAAYTNEHYQQCASGDFGFALGMICLIEEFTTPEFTLLFQALLRSCQQCLKMKPQDFVLNGGAEYFTANIADDERHREEMPQLVAIWLQVNGVDLENTAQLQAALQPVLNGAMHSASLRQQFFGGISDFVGKGGTYRDLAKKKR